MTIELTPVSVLAMLLILACILGVFVAIGRTWVQETHDEPRIEEQLERILLSLRDGDVTAARAVLYEGEDLPQWALRVAEAGLARVRAEETVARHLVELATEIARDDPAVVLTQARTLSRLGLHVEAHAAGERLLWLRPNSIAAQRIVAASAFGMGDCAKALRLLEGCLEQEPGNVELLADLIEVYHREGELVRASELVTHALDRLSKAAEMGAYRGDSLTDANELYARLQDLDDLIRRDAPRVGHEHAFNETLAVRILEDEKDRARS